jgi:hypothetical protein
LVKVFSHISGLGPLITIGTASVSAARVNEPSGPTTVRGAARPAASGLAPDRGGLPANWWRFRRRVSACREVRADAGACGGFRPVNR